jgi:hypothetical protein
LDSARFELLGTSLNLDTPSFLDAFLDFRIETFDERRDELGTIPLA